MKQLTLAEHRARIDNINLAEKNNKKYYARKRIHDYLPGQAIYNLGDYPSPFSMAPTEYDERLVADLAGLGVFAGGVDDDVPGVDILGFTVVEFFSLQGLDEGGFSRLTAAVEEEFSHFLFHNGSP